MSDDSDREPSAQESDHNDDLVGGAWEEEDEEEEEEEERRPSSRGKAVEREVSTLLLALPYQQSTLGFCD
jgi:hypothetical protein